MPSHETPAPNSGRKLFFGLFIFPLLIAVGMSVLLCAIVFLTTERETPETLVASIKTGAPGKRWQKAFELSNEMNRQTGILRNEALEREIVSILEDPTRYDAKTRSYMALALTRFRSATSHAALRGALRDAEVDVRLFALYALGAGGDRDAAADALPFLGSDSPAERKMAVYVLGALGDPAAAQAVRPLLSDSAVDVRWNAAIALARLGSSDGLPVLSQMLDVGHLRRAGLEDAGAIEETRSNAVKGLALIDHPDSVKILTELSRNDASLKIRQAALDALKARNPGPEAS